MGKLRGEATPVFYTSHPGNVQRTVKAARDCAHEMVVRSSQKRAESAENSRVSISVPSASRKPGSNGCAKLKDEAGEKPYALLFEALRQSKFYALAKVAIHNREHIIILRPGSKGILSHTMYYQDEIRQADAVGSFEEI